MKIKVNGELVNLDLNSPTVLNIINLLGFNPSLIVVEFNGKILPPSKRDEEIVKDGDSLEIVTIVGGGS